jgi:hypothetical protein
MMEKAEAFDGFHPISAASVRNPDGTALLGKDVNGAVRFSVTAEYDAVYRIHVFQNAGALADSPGPYSYLKNDTFPTYVSSIKSSDPDISFYLPLKKGKNILRFWTLQDGLYVYGVSSSRVSHEYSAVICGKENLIQTLTEGQTRPQGFQNDTGCFMLRSSSGRTDALGIQPAKHSSLPNGRYNIGLCCASDFDLRIVVGGENFTKNVSTAFDGLTNTSTGAAYVSTSIEAKDLPQNAFFIQLASSAGWANIGAIILHKI